MHIRDDKSAKYEKQIDTSKAGGKHATERSGWGTRTENELSMEEYDQQSSYCAQHLERLVPLHCVIPARLHADRSNVPIRATTCILGPSNTQMLEVATSFRK